MTKEQPACQSRPSMGLLNGATIEWLTGAPRSTILAEQIASPQQQRQRGRKVRSPRKTLLRGREVTHSCQMRVPTGTAVRIGSHRFGCDRSRPAELTPHGRSCDD